MIPAIDRNYTNLTTLLDTLAEEMFDKASVSEGILKKMAARRVMGEAYEDGPPGTAWTDKNLKQDMLEEIEDLANYLLFGMARRLLANTEERVDDITYGIVSELILNLYWHVSNLEDFEEAGGET